MLFACYWDLCSVLCVLVLFLVDEMHEEIIEAFVIAFCKKPRPSDKKASCNIAVVSPFLQPLGELRTRDLPIIAVTDLKS